MTGISVIGLRLESVRGPPKEKAIWVKSLFNCLFNNGLRLFSAGRYDPLNRYNLPIPYQWHAHCIDRKQARLARETV